MRTAGHRRSCRLFDEHTAAGSGAPALTTARLLATRRQSLPLYARLVEPPVQPHVAAECFRGLEGVPSTVLLALAEHWRNRDEIAVLSLLDVLLAHPQSDHLADFMAAFLRDSLHLDLVRSLAAAAVAACRPALIERMRAMAELEGWNGDPAREALMLLAG